MSASKYIEYTLEVNFNSFIIKVVFLQLHTKKAPQDLISKWLENSKRMTCATVRPGCRMFTQKAKVAVTASGTVASGQAGKRANDITFHANMD